jgi:hypothetical protein
MWAWFKEQNSTSKTLIILALCAAVGIVLRWRHVSGAVADTVKGLFEQAP